MSILNLKVQFDKYRHNKRKDYNNITSNAVDEVRFIPKVVNYQFIIMNHNNWNIVDILSNRYGNTLKQYFENKLSNIILIFQDFWDNYIKSVLGLNQSVSVVADKFHLARFATWAFHRTRVSLQ